MKKNFLRPLTVTAVSGAVGFVLMLLEFPIAFLIPPFIKLDFSEIPALIVSFAFGPVWGIICCLIKNLLHLFVSSSLGVGELANFILGAVFTGSCGLIYKYNKTRKGALISSLFGALLMAVISVGINAVVVYPAYVKIYGMPMEAIIGMYKAILSYADTLPKALLIFNLPFTLFKGLIDSCVCFAVYKKISPILKFGISKKRT